MRPASSPEPRNRLLAPEITREQQFSAALQGWHTARAAVLAGELSQMDEEQLSELDKLVRAAEWRLVKTPAFRLHDVLERAAVVDIMMRESEHSGEPTDGVHFAMLSALRTDIGRLPQ